MTSEQVFAAATGGTVGLGVALIIRGLWPPKPAPGDAGSPGVLGRLLARLRDLGRDPNGPVGGAAEVRWRWRWPVALAALPIAWLLTGWPMAGLVVVAVVLVAPVVAEASGAEMRAIERVEALGIWARALADVLADGAGLEPAVVATLGTCPDGIRGPVGDLAAGLTSRQRAEPALHAFADDLHDADADLVVAAILLGVRGCLPEPGKALHAAVDMLGERLAVRRRLEELRVWPRRKTRRSVTGVGLAVLALAVLNPSYLRPYGTTIGQVVLAVLAVASAAVLRHMYILCHARPGSRLLGPAVSAPRAAREVGGAV